MKISLRRPLSRAFTLIELLVVISIIAVLASISVPVTSTVMNRARKATCQNDCMQLQNAIKGFYNEYYAYPVRGDSEGPYETDGDLMDVLMSADSAEADDLNRRKIPFWEPSKMAKSEKVAGYHPDTGRLNDPWGQMYEVYMDADDNESLNVPSIYGDKFGRTGRIKRPIFVHSSGIDKKFEDVKDNVSSWD